MDRVQDVEFFFDKPLQILFLKEKQVAVPLVLVQNTSGGAGPGVNALVDLREQGGPGGLRQVFHKVLVVVQQQHRGHRPGGLEQVPQLGELRHVDPVGGSQEAAALVAGADQVAEYPVAASVVLHLVRALCFPFHEPVGVEVGGQGGQLGVKQMLPAFGKLQKTLVGPDHVVALQPENDHRQGGVCHGVLAGYVHGAGDSLDIFDDLFFAAAAGTLVVQAQQHHDQPLDDGDPQVERRADHGEQGQADKVELHPLLEQLIDLTIHEDKRLLTSGEFHPRNGI